MAPALAMMALALPMMALPMMALALALAMMALALALTLDTNNKLTSCGKPSFPEGNVLHELKFLNRLQALDFTEAGVASYASSQAGNQRLDSTPSFATAQCSGCQLDSRVVWVTAWTNVLCVLGMSAFSVDIDLPHSGFRSPPQTRANPWNNTHI